MTKSSPKRLTASKIRPKNIQLPFPAEVDGSGLESAIGPVAHKPLAEGIAETVGMFRNLIAAGKLEAKSYIENRS